MRRTWQHAAGAIEIPALPEVTFDPEAITRRLRRKARVDRGRIGRFELITCAGMIVGTALACWPYWGMS